MAEKYDKKIRKHLQRHAAWIPVTDKYVPGNYGVMKNGIFKYKGDISEFIDGIEIDEPPGADSSIDLNLISKGTKITRFSGGGEVKVFPQADVDARMDVKFSSWKKNRCYLKADKFRVSRLRHPNQIAFRLGVPGLKDKKTGRMSWNLNWVVVTAVYKADYPVLFISKEKGSSFSLHAKASVLKKLDVGDVSADIGHSSDQAMALDISGNNRDGTVALDLFQVGMRPGPDGGEGEAVELSLRDDSFWATLTGYHTGTRGQEFPVVDHRLMARMAIDATSSSVSSSSTFGAPTAAAASSASSSFTFDGIIPAAHTASSTPSSLASSEIYQNLGAAPTIAHEGLANILQRRPTYFSATPHIEGLRRIRREPWTPRIPTGRSPVITIGGADNIRARFQLYARPVRVAPVDDSSDEEEEEEPGVMEEEDAKPRAAPKSRKRKR